MADSSIMDILLIADQTYKNLSFTSSELNLRPELYLVNTNNTVWFILLINSAIYIRISKILEIIMHNIFSYPTFYFKILCIVSFKVLTSWFHIQTLSTIMACITSRLYSIFNIILSITLSINLRHFQNRCLRIIRFSFNSKSFFKFARRVEFILKAYLIKPANLDTFVLSIFLLNIRF